MVAMVVVERFPAWWPTAAGRFKRKDRQAVAGRLLGREVEQDT